MLYTPRCGAGYCSLCCEKIHPEFFNNKLHRNPVCGVVGHRVGYTVNNPVRAAIERAALRHAQQMQEEQVSNDLTPEPIELPQPVIETTDVLKSNPFGYNGYVRHFGVEKDYYEFVGPEGGENLKLKQLKGRIRLDEPATAVMEDLK